MLIVMNCNRLKSIVVRLWLSLVNSAITAAWFARVAGGRISDLLAAALEAGVDLSAALERALTDELAASKRKKWREENQEAIEAYNEHVEKHGTFSAGAP